MRIIVPSRKYPLDGLGDPPDPGSIDTSGVDTSILDVNYDPSTFNPGFVPGAMPGTTSTPTPSSSSGGFNWTQLFGSLANLGTGIVKGFQIAQGPSVIPGTNLVYNPATGQMVPATGIASGNLTTATSMLPMLAIVAIGGVLLVMAMKK